MGIKMIKHTHSKPKTTSKFIREYGATLADLARKYNSTYGYLYILHQRGELHQFIDDQEARKEKEKLVTGR